MRRLSTTVDALKRDQDDMRQLPTTVDALKRNQDALKRDLDKERSRTATLEQRLDEIEKTLPPCPGGYTKWRGICYMAFNTRKTFDQAAAACLADGGTLAMPRDAETNTFLISLYKSVSEDWNFWFGLHDWREEGRFEWVDGSALGSYSSWAPGQPNNDPGDQDCVLYSTQSSLKDKWFDYDCHQRFYFICQTAPGRP
ncbi:alpha-N-acetylgalactosamine-specific lectin-like [Branchiostoma floridae x Branchiostoma belcheri]